MTNPTESALNTVWVIYSYNSDAIVLNRYNNNYLHINCFKLDFSGYKSMSRDTKFNLAWLERTNYNGNRLYT